MKAARFLLLGDVAVENGDATRRLGGPKQRALLAYLLLNERRIVSVDELVDAVWGEAAPPTAGAIVHSYVGKLRAALEGTGARIETRSPGYALELSGADTDARAFEQLAASGRDALQAGDAEAAREQLASALALWRGRALADVRDIPGIAADARGLDELRLEAIEDRIEADLETGRHRDVVAELQRLVRENPYRERLRAQLMRALYAGGNQAAALEEYRAARRLFADELGIEPGPELQQLERAILNHDPRLGPSRRSKEQREPGPRPVSWRAVAAAAAALAAVAVVVGVATRGGRSAAVRAGSVAAIDPRTGRVSDDISVGVNPVAVAGGDGAVWVANSGDDTVTRIDARTKRATSIGLPSSPTAVGVGPSGAWVAGSFAITHLSPRGALVGTTALRRGVPGGDVNEGTTGVAVGRHAVWLGSGDFQLLRLDPDSGAVVRRYDLPDPVGPIAVGDGSVWSAAADRVVTRFDPAEGIAPATIDLGAPTGTSTTKVATSSLAYGFGAAWALMSNYEALWRVDASTNDATGRTSLPTAATNVATGAGAVWLTSPSNGTLLRVDPTSGKITKTIRIGHSPSAVTVYGGKVWVTVQ